MMAAWGFLRARPWLLYTLAGVALAGLILASWKSWPVVAGLVGAYGLRRAQRTAQRRRGAREAAEAYERMAEDGRASREAIRAAAEADLARVPSPTTTKPPESPEERERRRDAIGWGD